MGFRADARAGAVTMLEAYASSASIKLQVYPGRPASINPPTAFVDAIFETFDDFTLTTQQRHPQVNVVILHGLFDSKEAVDQGDAFIDGFLAWALANPHAFGPNSVQESVRTQDVPAYTADWMAPELRRTYFATILTLEGLTYT